MNVDSRPLHVEWRSRRVPKVEERGEIFAAFSGSMSSTAIKVTKDGGNPTALT